MDSRTVDLWGPVHYLEGGSGRPTFVCIHGLGGSHVNWCAVVPRLAERGRVLVPDLVGHGRTPPAGRLSTLSANTRLIGRFLATVAGEPAILVGNSMGGLLSLLTTAQNPRAVAGLVLVNPSLPRAPGSRIDGEIARNFAAYAVPGFGKRYMASRRARLGPEGLVAETLRYCVAEPSRVPPEVIAAAVAFAQERVHMPWGDEAFLQAARSILAIHAGRRSTDLLRRLPRVPTLLVHGEKDRLVPLASAEMAARMRPDWTVEVLSGVGHVPQLEVPDLLLEVIERWLKAEDLTSQPVA